MSMPHNPTIMIVEDNEVDYETARRALKRTDSSIRTLWYRTAEDAIDALTETESNDAERPRPAFVLVDINMPGVGGISFLKKIKDAASPLKMLPIIMLSSSERQSDIDSCYNAGANGYLVKTSDLDRFYGNVATLCAYWFATVRLPSDSTTPEEPTDQLE